MSSAPFVINGKLHIPLQLSPSPPLDPLFVVTGIDGNAGQCIFRGDELLHTYICIRLRHIYCYFLESLDGSLDVAPQSFRPFWSVPLQCRGHSFAAHDHELSGSQGQ